MWATAEAIDENYVFDQILLSLPLISRRLDVDELVKQKFLDLIEKIKQHLEVNQIWLSNEDIIESTAELMPFKRLINKNFLSKFNPKQIVHFTLGHSKIF